MMEFLEKLYSQEYFAPVLFTVIAILALLFIIVLVLALRDAKKKKAAQGGTNDAFAQVSEEPQEINVNVSAPAPVEVKNENVINSVEPSANGFENIEVPAPVASNNETPIVSEPNVEPVDPTVPVEPVAPTETVAPVQEEPQDIQIEATPEVNNVENNDLDSIASTLLSEYQKETTNNEEKVETPTIQPNDFSSVGVKPNTLPVEEENKSVDFPNLNDIPMPQPVRVTETSTVIDSSKQNVDDIPTEEYNINK